MCKEDTTMSLIRIKSEHVCVCVCVCGREEEKEGGRDGGRDTDRKESLDRGREVLLPWLLILGQHVRLTTHSTYLT